jgi:hypothetical protein
LAKGFHQIIANEAQRKAGVEAGQEARCSVLGGSFNRGNYWIARLLELKQHACDPTVRLQLIQQCVKEFMVSMRVIQSHPSRVLHSLTV